MSIKEKDIQNLLIKELKTLGGTVDAEVKCSHGRADIVTPNLLIEIKEATRYKEAIGQLLTYSKQIKNKFPVLYLFSREGNLLTYKEQNNIFTVCRQNKIWFYQHNPSNPYGFISWLAGRKFITKVPYNVQNRIENKNLYKDVDKSPCKVYDSKGKLVKTIY